MILVVPTDTWPHHAYRECGDDERSTAEAYARVLRRNGVAVEVVETNREGNA